MDIAIGLDRVKYKSKPTKIQTKNIYNRMDAHAIVSLEEFQKAVGSGQSYRAAVINKSDLSFVSQQLFPFDFDGTPYETVLTVAKRAGIEPAVVYPTFSQSPDEPLVRYRMIFLSDHVITNERIRNGIEQRLIKLFRPYCDESCRHHSRLYYGGRNTIVADFSKAYDFEKLWDIKEDSFQGWGNTKKS